MKVLLDTNVVLDVLLDREPFAAAAIELLSRIEMGEVDGYVCATTVTTIHYLGSKAAGGKQAVIAIHKLLAIFEVAPVNRPVLAAALDARWADFEDAVVHEAARHVSAQAIVTRNPGDFKKSALPTYSPKELCELLDLRARDDG